MLVALGVLVAGVCIGVVSATARAPRIRMVPLICVGALACLGASWLMYLDAANLPLALAFVAVTIVSSAAYGARLWVEQFAADSPGYGQLFLLELFRPGRLRAIHRARQAGSP